MVNDFLVSIVVVFTNIFPSCAKLIELNHESLSSTSQTWPKPEYEESFQMTPLYRGYTKDGYWFSTHKFCATENLGTHLNAPSQYAERGWTLDQIPIERLIVPAVVIDIREQVKNNSLYQLSPTDVIEWVETHGLFPNNSVVLVQTGWSERYGDKAAYFGHESDPSKLIFPGVSLSTAQVLLGYRSMSGIHIVGVGIDAPSVDYGPSRFFNVHQELASANVYILENLNNLSEMPLRDVELIVMPLKIKGGSGSPCRVIARTAEKDEADDLPKTCSASVTLTSLNLSLLLSFFKCVLQQLIPECV